jgi:protein farnesyltransferase/geranylgeranyltransferase type-1 subunit alpha
MSADLNQELNFMDTFAEENPKNYQIWYHRRLIVERSGDPSRELDFTKAVFEVDSKNYHAWSHRLSFVVVTTLGIYLYIQFA